MVFIKCRDDNWGIEKVWRISFSQFSQKPNQMLVRAGLNARTPMDIERRSDFLDQPTAMQTFRVPFSVKCLTTTC